jgi:hypothetical protein
MKVKKHTQKAGKVQQKGVNTLKKNTNQKHTNVTKSGSKAPLKGKASKNQSLSQLSKKSMAKNYSEEIISAKKDSFVQIKSKDLNKGHLILIDKKNPTSNPMISPGKLVNPSKKSYK